MRKQQVARRILLYHLLLSLAHYTFSADLPDTQQPDAQHHHRSDSKPSNQDEFRLSTESSTDSRRESSLPEPDPSDPSESSEANGLYQAPYDLEVIRFSDTSVVLRWDIPHASMQVLQFFKIQYRLTKKKADWKTESYQIPPMNRAHQINGLRPGNYYFIVSAVYDNDDNIASEQKKYTLRASSKIPPVELPEKQAPKIRWNETAPDYIRFKWKWPVKERDIPNFGYLVYYRSAFSVGEFTIYNTLDEDVELAELEPDTPYEAKVIAYNLVGVSDFSETITLRTKPKSTVSTTALPGTNATVSPTIVAEELTTTTTTTTTTTPTPYEPSTTLAPHVGISIVTENPAKAQSKVTILNETTITASPKRTISMTSFSDLYVQLMTGKDDISVAIKYSLFFLLPLIIIVSSLICLISCHRKRKSPPSSTDEFAQMDLEINSYFKNSFPGVEKDLTLMANGHHGFVNNLPHINDYA